ncbi:hypothetical protein GW17_00054797 [Ensete ventricosum]|nr:hypothetical protein GW17_00054797 [Ensete ventricosum]
MCNRPYILRKSSSKQYFHKAQWIELILHGAKDKGSFEAHASYLINAFDGLTKVIQLAEAKLGSGYLSTGQEDVEAGTLEEYVIVLSFELLRTMTRVFHVCASKLAPNENLGHQHIGVVYHRGRSQIASTSESHGGDLIIQRWSKGARKLRRVRRGSATQKAKCRLERRWTQRSATVPQRRIYRSQRKGHRCKAMDNRAMGLAPSWYRKGGTSVESSIPCSHGWRALVVKGAEEVENAEANSKYRGKAEAKELHKTGVDGLFIKIAESEGLQVDA